jgi:hypothetical protein
LGLVTEAAIEESDEEIPETPDMLLSPKRLITYFYPLLLLHFSTLYYMNMNMDTDTASQQKPNKQASKNRRRLTTSF